MKSLGTPVDATIDVRTTRLLIGLIAIGLASFVDLLTPGSLSSISAAYFAGDWPRNFFVGCLFVIASFLLSYNGLSAGERIVAKTTAVAAACVALFPCDCAERVARTVDEKLECLGGMLPKEAAAVDCLVRTQEIPHAHGVAASVLFAALAIFCYIFWHRAAAKTDERKTNAARRVLVYQGCFALIAVSGVAMLYDFWTGQSISDRWQNFLFWAEGTALFFFGVSWLTASYVIPGLAHGSKELFNPLEKHNPPLIVERSPLE